MLARFRIVGAAMVVAGVIFVGVGGYAYAKTQQRAPPHCRPSAPHRT
jgi:hypothetical protein